jgi:hypothetical protein
MKLVIEYKDKKTPAPKVITDENENWQLVTFDTPFALVQTSIVNEDGEREIRILIGQKKKCTGPCGEERAENEFHGSKTSRDGKQGVCIYCKKFLDRERRRKLLEAEDETE